jgi:2-keto-myo-inositol isomerase
MIHFALNHMTVARLSFAELVALSKTLGCVGVEVRNDLPQPLFDGMDPAEAGAFVRDNGMRLLAVAEVKRFNDWSERPQVPRPSASSPAMTTLAWAMANARPTFVSP